MRRAIGIIRVSQVSGRNGESFASPAIQLARIQAACERDGLELVQTHEELDVSGGKPLAERPGLSQAIHAIELGDAEVVVAAYFDRLFRSLATQAEVLERVEAAGGHVVAVDVGRVTNDSATQWLSGTMHGMMAEYFRRSVKDRSGEAQARAVARGVLPYPNVPPGYERDADGVLQPDSNASVIADAFRLRAQGATVKDVRAHLLERGVQRSYHGVLSILASRVYLGEVHFGELVNLAAHEPIVDRDVWQAVQGLVVPRGRKAKSDRLLARLGVLRCGSCGARMVVGTANHRQYAIYRCPPTGDCARRVTISARVAEEKVWETVRDAMRDAQGRASMAESAQDAVSRLSTAQESLDTALRVFTLTGAENETSAVERLTELRQERDDAQSHIDQLRPQSAQIVSNPDDLNFEERRDAIRFAVEWAKVAPGGRGADRIMVKLRSFG